MQVLSESMRRLGPETMPPLSTKQQERLEIEEQVQAFLRQGGRIRVLPTRIGDPEPEAPKRPSQDNVAGFKADLHRGGLLIDGEHYINTARAAKISGWSKSGIDTYIWEDRYVPIRKVSRRNFVRLTDALAWAAENGKTEADREAARRELESLA